MPPGFGSWPVPALVVPSPAMADGARRFYAVRSSTPRSRTIAGRGAIAWSVLCWKSAASGAVQADWIMRDDIRVAGGRRRSAAQVGERRGDPGPVLAASIRRWPQRGTYPPPSATS